jgi:histidinol-phosphate aminotransferase
VLVSEPGRPPFTRLVEQLPAMVPFVGPETLERRTGVQIRLRLGANESPFGASPRVREAISEWAAGVSNYGDPEIYDLRRALAAHHGVGMENLVVASGIDELLGLIVRAFLEPGQVAVTSLGAYPTFNYHVEGFGGCLARVPYREWRNDLEALVETARARRARLLFLANPDNPTGSYHGSAALIELLQRLPDGCLLVLDEAYLDFAPEDRLPLDPADPRLLRLRTFSKAHGLAGMRVGYAIGSAQLVAGFDKIRLHFGVGVLAQAAALAALRDQGFVASVAAAVAEGRRDYERMAELGQVRALSSATNFVAFDVGDAERARAVADRLWERGVFVRRGPAPPLDRCVRITVGRPEQRRALEPILLEALDATAP